MDEGHISGVKRDVEELFPDADRLNLEEMQRRLDEQQAHAESRALAPATIYSDGKLRDPQ
jgi:hypothetical protein